MKGKILSVVIGLAVSVSFAQASWVIVNEDGSTKRLNSCCNKKVRVVKKVVKAPEFCETCDYSKFKMADLLPVGAEKLEVATLRNCGK